MFKLVCSIEHFCSIGHVQMNRNNEFYEHVHVHRHPWYIPILQIVRKSLFETKKELGNNVSKVIEIKNYFEMKNYHVNGLIIVVLWTQYDTCCFTWKFIANFVHTTKLLTFILMSMCHVQMFSLTFFQIHVLLFLRCP